MAVYTQLDIEEVRRIAADFEIEARDFSAIAGGASNTNLIVHSNRGEFILTLFEARERPAVHRLANLLLLLEEAGIPANHPLQNKNGSRVGEFKGMPLLIKNRIAGSSPVPDEALLKSAGAVLARLHAVQPPAELPDEHSYFREILPRLRQAGPEKTAAGEIADRLERLAKDRPLELPDGLTHGDLFYDNILSVNGKLRAILDFEEACRAPFVFDLGMALLGCCTRDGRPDLDAAAALLAGYGRERKLNATEIAALPTEVEAAATGTAGWRYWKFNLETKLPERREHYKEMLARAEVWRDAAADLLRLTQLTMT